MTTEVKAIMDTPCRWTLRTGQTQVGAGNNESGQTDSSDERRRARTNWWWTQEWCPWLWRLLDWCRSCFYHLRRGIYRRAANCNTLRTSSMKLTVHSLEWRFVLNSSLAFSFLSINYVKCNKTKFKCRNFLNSICIFSFKGGRGEEQKNMTLMKGAMGKNGKRGSYQYPKASEMSRLSPKV